MINKQVDYKLFFTVFALIIFWMVMISSVSVYSSFRVTSILEKSWSIEQAYNYFYVIKNIIHVFLAMIVLIFVVKIPYLWYEKNVKYLFWWALVVMFYVLFFWTTWNWATWWINIPWLPFAIQPVEFLKISLILFLAYFLKKNKQKLHTFYEWFLPFFWIMFLIVMILWLQPDFGSVLVIVPIMVAMFFVSWARVKYLLTFFVFWIILLLSVYNLWKYDKTNPETRNKLSYITDRIDNFITDEKEQIAKKTINYQTEQWLIAIWSWGFFGLWFWQSIQKFWYLPEVQWDFIFSVIIEELWFLWWLILLLVYSYIWYRGYRISYYSSDLFAKYVAFGITTRILVQTFINVWVNLNIVPLTWLTLPFVSYWWSSLLALTLALAIILNISRYNDFDINNNLRWKTSFWVKSRVNMY